MNPDKLFTKIKQIFQKDDKLILLTTFIVGIITNFYFFISRGLQADALSSSYFRVAGNWETKLGRPFIQFTDQARFGFVNQLLIVLISLLFIAGFMMLIRRTFNIKSRALLFAITVLITVAPQFTETYMFLYCADSYLLAFFLSALAVFAMTKIKTLKESKLWALLAIGCSGYICGLYQAYLGVVLGLLIIYTIKNTLDEAKVSVALKKFIRNIILIFAGVALYYIALRVGLKFAHARLASYKGADGLGLETILALPKTISNCFVDFYNFFFHGSAIINNAAYPRFALYGILLAAIILGAICIIKRNKNYKKLPFILFLTLIFPICINVMDIIAKGTRVNIVTGPGLITTALFIVVIYEYMKETKFENILRFILIFATIILSWTYIIADTFTYIVRDQEYDSLETTLNDIYVRSSEVEGYTKDTKWLFSFYFNTTDVKNIEMSHGMTSRNNITWPSYTGVKRYAYFYKKFMGKTVTFEDEEKYDEIIATDEFKNMPVYPAKGSMKVINNTFVVKVSERTFK